MSDLGSYRRAVMSTEIILQQLFPGRVLAPRTPEEIPRNVSLVYILCSNDQPIVVGTGKFNRARVIFDDASRITRGHLKSLFVRLRHLYDRGEVDYQRFVIPFDSMTKARGAEKQLHQKIGGNHRRIDPGLQTELLRGLAHDTIPWLLLNQAIHSAFDGQDDLIRWWKKGLIHEHDWAVVKDRLRLP